MSRRLGSWTLGLLLASIAGAQQYRVVVLAPNGDCYASYGGHQYGTIRLPNSSHAAIWSNSAGSMVDANGAWQDSSFRATDGTNAVGWIYPPGAPGGAAFYDGASGTWSLLPGDYTSMQAAGIWGDYQVGYGGYGPNHILHALLWHGPTGSVVDLTPSSTTGGAAIAIYNGVIAGWHGVGDARLACIWNGTPESRVELHPPGAVASAAAHIYQNEEVGFLTYPNDFHACLWHGTAESCVDLNPTGYFNSVAYGTDGTREVGSGVLIGGLDHALLWFGSKDNYVDLQAFVSSDYDDSVATGIDPITGAICGWAHSTVSGDYSPMVWLPVKALSGHVTLGNYGGPVAGQAVTIEVRNPGTTTVVDSYTTTLDAAGNFSVSTTQFGSYDVAVKASHWLRKVAQNVAFGRDSVAPVSVTLINGDVNGDNAVTLGDFAQQRAAFGASSGDPNWNANADLNGDGSVSLGDFAILRAHFGQVGDN